MRRSLTLLVILLAGFVAACSTVEGAGRDIGDSSRWVRNRI